MDYRKKFEELKKESLSLDMSRGKPSPDILDISDELLSKPLESYLYGNGADARNYGDIDGIPEAKAFFEDLIGIPKENIFVGGNSSLFLMYNIFNMLWTFGMNGRKPWGAQKNIKILCPCPGYDRHFAVSKEFGAEHIIIPMNEDGPDMDMIEKLVKDDDEIKGIWCVPLYSNPEGVVYSKEVCERLASLKTKADDFHIFWDNAYGVHHIWEKHEIPNMFELCKAAGYEDRLFYFFSTSKITFPGGGISLFACSSSSYSEMKKRISIQKICFDKINQVRQINFLKDKNNLEKHMAKIADILRPKFDIVLESAEKMKADGLIDYKKPLGGYFVSIDVKNCSAKKVIELAKECGVKLTPAGATFPNGIDPEDKNIRIAPTYPSVSELEKSLEVLETCIGIAREEK
jgi:DNA-binding transcriptional MocR family regulator